MKTLYLIFFLCCFQILSAQTNTNFRLSKQYFVRGDAKIIGNTILSKYKKKSFNNKFVINDVVKMKYVDIDNDKSTFSSSQATLKVPENTKRIVNATLYWSAIYSFNRGVKKRKGNNIVYRGNNVRDKDIHKIKFKIPNYTYQNIEGKVLYDGFEKSKNTDNAPYVCYLDVTDIINKNQNKNGVYTVANIKATQGFTTGGSSGGWLLHVVFETESGTPKFINTYHGINTISKKPLHIELNGFKTVKEENVKAALTLATLEGDSGLGRDQCLIYNQKKEKFIPLKNKLRPARNFFNGAITINEENFKDRLPYNLNNLGFDIVEMDLPNQNNQILTNATTSLKLKLQTKSDRFHLFFASFKTEVDSVFFKDKKEIEERNIENKTKINGLLVKDSEYINGITDLANKEIAIKKNITIPNLKSGYYIISNVFSNPDFAEKWKDFLKNKNHTPITFVNPENQWQYVSIFNNLDKNKAILELEQLNKYEYFKDLWIQKINLD